MSRLRSENNLWLVGTTIEEILGAKLPLNSHILRNCLYHRDNSYKTLKPRIILKKNYDHALSRFWIPSRIPTKAEKNCLDQMDHLIWKYESLKKTKSRITSAASQEKIKQFVDSLQSLFDISHSNAEKLLQKSGNPEWLIDWPFLQDQREIPQVGCMDGVSMMFQKWCPNFGKQGKTKTQRRRYNGEKASERTQTEVK